MIEHAPDIDGIADVPTLAEDPAMGLPQRQKMEILFAVLLGIFLAALDQTIVGPALPTIVSELSGNEYYTWAVTAFLLTSTISVPFWGKLSDIYGRKPIFMIGIVIFLIGSALSGLSQTMEQLVLFRGIQGIGAGSLFPVALAVIGDLFTPQERGKYQGLFGAVFGIAFVVGPLVGGFLTENVGWHWIFYVNIPIGIVSLIVIQRLLPTVRPRVVVTSTSRWGHSPWPSVPARGLTNKQFGDGPTRPSVGSSSSASSAACS
jgi:multidrug resistance protein